MQGVEWTWRHTNNEFERMICLLAGLAVLTTKGRQDPLRKLDAFGGRFDLPFFGNQSPTGRYVCSNRTRSKRG